MAVVIVRIGLLLGGKHLHRDPAGLGVLPDGLNRDERVIFGSSWFTFGGTVCLSSLPTERQQGPKKARRAEI
jgi:hypothetical protein